MLWHESRLGKIVKKSAGFKSRQNVGTYKKVSTSDSACFLIPPDVQELALVDQALASWAF